MEFVRKVVDVTDLKNVIEIPNSLANKKVEILIFPIEEIKPKKKNKKHIQIINKKAIEAIADEIQGNTKVLTENEQIKRAIKLYR